MNIHCKKCKKQIPEGFDILQEGYCPGCRWKLMPERYEPVGLIQRTPKKLKPIK